MAGGLGTRLKPLTQIIPKPLLPVGEKSILEIMIRQLKLHEVDTIILATGYKPDMFESYLGDGSSIGVKIIYSREKKPLGTVGPLKLVEELLTEPFIVMNGDILTNLNFSDLKKFHYENNADISVVTNIVTFPLDYGMIRSDGKKITAIEEKPRLKTEIIAGIYLMNPEMIKEIPGEKQYHMTELLQKLITENKRIYRYLSDAYWLDIGRMSDYEKVREDVSNGAFKC